MLVLLVAGLVGGPLLLMAILAVVDGSSDHDFVTVFIAGAGTNGLLWGINSAAGVQIGPTGMMGASVIISFLLISWLCNTTFARALVAALVYGFAMSIALRALLPGLDAGTRMNRPLASVERDVRCAGSAGRV